MERHVRDQLADVRMQLAIGVPHKRVLSSKYIADRYLKDLQGWIDNDSHKRSCGADFVQAIRQRILDMKEEGLRLKAESQARPTERRRRRREERQHQADLALAEERLRAVEALEQAQAALAEVDRRIPDPVGSSTSTESQNSAEDPE